MLADGEPIEAVIASICGRCREGEAWRERLLAAVSVHETHAKRRRVLELLLRQLEHMERHGHGWRIVGAGAYVGRRHTLVRKTHLDHETGEVLETDNWKRGHCPKSQAGGLAAKMDLHPRTLDEYRRTLKAGRVIKSQRMTRHQRGAVLPKNRPDAHWAYAHTWLAFPPSAEMLRRFRGHVPPRYDRAEGRRPAPAPAFTPPASPFDPLPNADPEA